jgi:hypothetical protein
MATVKKPRKKKTRDFMVPLSARGPRIFPLFFEKETQALLKQLEASQKESQAMAVVPQLHLFQGTKATVQQNLEVGGRTQSGTALGTVQIVGRNNMGTIGAEANFHTPSLGQLP